VSAQRRTPSTRVRLWAIAWGFAFLHFAIRAVTIHSHPFDQIMDFVDESALVLSGIVFLSSVMFAEDDQTKRLRFIATLSIPLVAYAFANTFHGGLFRTSAGLLALVFVVAAGLSVYAPARRGFVHMTVALAITSLGVFAMHRQLGGHPKDAVATILCISFALCGSLFWRLNRRPSLGVITTTAGFLGWAAAYPISALLHALAPNSQGHLDFWNVPRVFVALGMMLTLLEDKTLTVERAGARVQSQDMLVERLSNITSQLLAGNDPGTLSGEVATVITEASSFRRAALFLLGEDRRFYLAGMSGFTPQEAETLQTHSSGYAIESQKQQVAQKTTTGRKSFRMVEGSDLTLIPMVSWRGLHVGCLYISDSREPGGAAPSEMEKLERFVRDLAVTFENVRLRQQLMRSEKLAGLGQLVAGVAHELNNPLTGIIGYSDLLGEEVREEKAARRIKNLGNEARRMKRIVDGLLLFGRRNNSPSQSTDLQVALHEVVQLREYHLSANAIKLDIRVEPSLPRTGIGEDELKQVLLNLLSNAIDAVTDSAKREIRIRAFSRSGRTVVSFEDSGPGFADLARAFDPFYTTKPVGKGTGLGLSICYGVVQECGGEITIANQQPYGASVVLDLPVAVAQSPLFQPTGTIWDAEHSTTQSS
jgi:two-component system, NtrC family, sensor kinase